jgi:hypothetical protein
LVPFVEELKEARMTEEIYRDRFGALQHDERDGILELAWGEGSAEMTDDDFMAWLTRYAEAAERLRPPSLLIDVTRFPFRPGAKVGPWRDEHIIPRYNAAGVRKLAFVVPAGTPGTVGTGNAPTPEPPGLFPTGYFDSREQARAWFAE